MPYTGGGGIARGPGQALAGQPLDRGPVGLPLRSLVRENRPGTNLTAIES